MQLVSYIRSRLHFFKETLIFRFKVFAKDGYIGKPLSLFNVQFISFGHSLRLKNGYRIDCYPSFCGKKLYPRLKIGNRVTIGPYFTALVADRIEIGDDTIFAGNVSLVSENHGINPELNIPYYAQELSTGSIKIGRGCWIGQGVVVLPDVEIGDKVIIGSNSVVSKNIPSYSIAVGVPAKVIKKFNFETHTWEKI